MTGNGKSKKSIMIVDDDADICIVMKKSLDGEYRISTFTSPTLALEHFKQEPEKYDTVVTDIRMPIMTGFQLAREVKAINPKTKVVLMTAFEINQSEFEKVLPHSIVEGFIQKPISTRALKEVLVKI
jgi:DNA-binding NtrC family response regulator